ncbi:MAG TPA: hypothetical protein VMO47_13860, partial [Rhodothermales bacterium]|nr:hypothetical protein [Rhodothermales bacterium]
MPLVPEGLPRAEYVALDGRVIMFAVVVTALTTLLFGLLPAREASRFDLYRSLKEETGGGIGQARSPLRSILVAAQVAVTLVLVTVAALLLNSFARLHMVDIGIDKENVVTFALQGTVAAGSRTQAAEYSRISDEVLARLQSHPDVRAAARSSVTPLRGESYRVYRRAHSERGWPRWHDPASIPRSCVNARSGWSSTTRTSTRRNG